MEGHPISSTSPVDGDFWVFMGFPHYCMFIIHHIQQKTIINTYVITINVFTTIFNHVVLNLSPFIMCAPTPWCRPAASSPSGPSGCARGWRGWRCWGCWERRRRWRFPSRG